jgi:hypothetical protein
MTEISPNASYHYTPAFCLRAFHHAFCPLHGRCGARHRSCFCALTLHWT